MTPDLPLNWTPTIPPGKLLTSWPALATRHYRHIYICIHIHMGFPVRDPDKSSGVTISRWGVFGLRRWWGGRAEA